MSRSYEQAFLKYDEQHVTDLPCEDVLVFQKKLQQLKQFDDKIINVLNSELPTKSFYSDKINPAKKCTDLQNEVQKYYNYRENAIKKCINKTTEDIVNYSKSNDVNKMVLREKQFKLHQFQEEITVDSIIRARSIKAIQERCHLFL